MFHTEFHRDLTKLHGGIAPPPYHADLVGARTAGFMAMSIPLLFAGAIIPRISRRMNVLDPLLAGLISGLIVLLFTLGDWRASLLDFCGYITAVVVVGWGLRRMEVGRGMAEPNAQRGREKVK